MKDILFKLIDSLVKLCSNPWFYIPSILLGLILYNYLSIGDLGKFALDFAERAKVIVNW